MADGPQSTLAQAVRSQHPGTYDDLSDADLENKVLAKYPQYSDMPRTKAPAPTTTSDSGGFLSDAEDVGIGALKGLGHSLTGLSPLINKIPYVGEALAPSQGIKAAQLYTQPQNTAQKIGYGGEQAAEFLLPTGVEGKAATELAAHAPMLGKLAAPAARLATSALSSGTVNKLQGGSFGGGAVLGGATGVLGEAGKAIAPSLAESAAGVTKRMRGFGKTPGAAALSELSAVRPGSVAQQAQKRLSELTSQLEDSVANAEMPTSNGPVPATASTQPALDVIDRAQKNAIQKNSKATYDMLNDLKNQLTTEFHTGQPIPQTVPASKILDLKRGIGDLETTWNPDQARGLRPTIRQVYHALDQELDGAVPGTAELNQRISSLIPIAKGAASAERGADFGQRVAHRVAAHTGALAGSVAGGAMGYQQNGAEGALVGAGTGLMVPEMVASPMGQMTLARTLNSPYLPRLGRSVIGSAFMPRSRSNP